MYGNFQALENLHQVMAYDEARFIHLDKQPEKKAMCMINHQNLGAMIDDS